jgi:hypothetical protein
LPNGNRKLTADLFAEYIWKNPSLHRTDSSSSRTHKSDSLPNFGVNNRLLFRYGR